MSMIEQKTINGVSLRCAVFDPVADDIHAVYNPGASVKEMGQAAGADVAINFNYADTDHGIPIGRLISGGKVVVQDIPKTVPRDELYMLPDRTLHIGKAPENAVWAIQGSPPLLRGGIVVQDGITRDRLSRDIWSQPNIRTAVGITADGKLVMVRTTTRIYLPRLADVMLQLGCVDALNGDGGGSSYMWPVDNGWGRKLGSALIAKRRGTTVTSKGIDCATPLTAKMAAALAAAGNRFAAQYLVPVRYAWKRLTRAGAEAITAAGMNIVSVFETDGSRARGGAENGTIDGGLALVEAKAVGQANHSAIYFACDWDVQPHEYDAIEAYLRAAQLQIPGYEVGVYGSYAVIEEMAKRQACKHFWQTYAWSYSQRSAHANIYQHQNDVIVAGLTVDLNESYGNEGWWNTKSVAPAPQPTPALSPDPQPVPPPVTPDPVKIVLNGKYLAWGCLIDNHSWVPARVVGIALGATIDFKNNTVYANGKALSTRLISGRGYVPVRELTTAAGVKIENWDEAKKIVTLTK